MRSKWQMLFLCLPYRTGKSRKEKHILPLRRTRTQRRRSGARITVPSAFRRGQKRTLPPLPPPSVLQSTWPTNPCQSPSSFITSSIIRIQDGTCSTAALVDTPWFHGRLLCGRRPVLHPAVLYSVSYVKHGTCSQSCHICDLHQITASPQKPGETAPVPRGPFRRKPLPENIWRVHPRRPAMHCF